MERFAITFRKVLHPDKYLSQNKGQTLKMRKDLNWFTKAFVAGNQVITSLITRWKAADEKDKTPQLERDSLYNEAERLKPEVNRWLLGQTPPVKDVWDRETRCLVDAVSWESYLLSSADVSENGQEEIPILDIMTAL